MINNKIKIEKMNKYKLILYNISFILIFLLNSVFSETFEYSLEEVFEYFNSQRLTEAEYEEMVSLISQTLIDIYAYNEISRNPVQPNYYSSYFSPINILQRLKELKIRNMSMYEFYQNITQIFADSKDPLISISWNMTDYNFIFINL